MAMQRSPRAAVAGADQRVDGLIQVGVGHHDHVVLGAAEALCALAVRGRARVDVLRDVGAADEADRLDLGVLEDRVDGFLVALHHLEHPGRQTGLDEQLGQPERNRGSRSEGLSTNAFPHASAGPAFHRGIIAGKLKGVMPATTPSGWRMEYTSMPVPAPSVNSPLSRWGIPTENSMTSSAALDVAQ